MSVATTKIERSGPAIRATLAEFAPDECALFETEFQRAMARACETFELAPLDAVVIAAGPFTGAARGCRWGDGG